jgi:ribosomal protein S18 acetylase RimI-like enzyme
MPLTIRPATVAEASYRRGGIGRRLVRACAAFAAADQAQAVLVEVPFSEPHLIAFYAGLGFAKDAVFELYRLPVVTSPA